MPLFYFALYRNRGTLRFPKNLRLLSLITAIVFGSYAAWDSWRWALAPDPRTIHHVGIFLGECSNLAYVLLLVTLFRQSSDELSGRADVFASRPLRLITKIVVIVWGIWVAFNVLKLAAIPILYPLLQSIALRTRRAPPRLELWVFENAQMLLTQACLSVAPYVIYNSWRRLNEAQDGLQPAPIDPSSLKDSGYPLESGGI